MITFGNFDKFNRDFSLQDLEMYNPLETQTAVDYVETGRQMTQNQIDAIITEKTEAYILEKANQLRVQVEVRVELSNDGIPLKAVIAGKLSQEEKEELSAFIFEKIGIDPTQWNLDIELPEKVTFFPKG